MIIFILGFIFQLFPAFINCLRKMSENSETFTAMDT